MSRSEHPLVDNLHWLSSPRTNRCPGLVQVASNKMALKMVIDAGKRYIRSKMRDE